MPYTPTTPTLTLCDALVSALNTAWAPVPPNGIERAYFKRVGDADSGDLEKLTGRRVVIYPTGYASEPASRGEDTYEHRVTVHVFERYPDAGDPPTEWIDERVDFVYEQIVQGLDYSHDGPPSFNRKLITESFDVTVLDVNRLLGAGSLFVSVVELVFLEIRNA